MSLMSHVSKMSDHLAHEVALNILYLIRMTTEQVWWMYLFLFSGCFDQSLNRSTKADQVLLLYLIIIFTLRAFKVILWSFCSASYQHVFCHSANSASERPQNKKCPRGVKRHTLIQALLQSFCCLLIEVLESSGREFVPMYKTDNIPSWVRRLKFSCFVIRDPGFWSAPTPGADY